VEQIFTAVRVQLHLKTK